MESLSSYAKRFVAQVAKPDVDFVFGLSPVISIEQKTLTNNPRSTVGTMTDIASYLNLLYATIGQAHCPRTGEPVPSRTSSQILEAILSLPEGTAIELRAPVFKVYGEDLEFVFTELRKKGVRRLIVDGKPVDLSDKVELDESSVTNMDAVVDRFVVSRKAREGDQGGDRGGAARRRRARAGQGPGQQDAPLRLRRHRARVLRVQQPRERVPHLRRPRRGQAHAPRAAGARPEAQHRRRLLRARGVQVQPGDLGRARHVQPVESARLLAGHAVEGPAREDPGPDPLRDRPEDHDDGAARGEARAREVGRARDRLSRDRAPDRALLPPVPPAGRDQLEDGGVARQGDGRAHLRGLQRRAAARDAAAVHRLRQRPSTTSASCISTSCTRFSAR